MADFGGIQIQTPQDVLARIQAQRDQFRQSGDPQVRRQASIDQALDSLFGNPQLQAAQKVSDAVNAAQKKVEPVAGESDLDSELRRLKAMRDAVADIDPAVGAQINQRMLVIGSQKLEREKLLADMQLKAKEDTRQDAEYNLKVATTQSQLDAAKTVQAEKEADVQNFVNPKTGEFVAVKAIDSIAAKRLIESGWVKAGVNVQVDDPTKLGGATKATQNDLQKSMLESQQQLDLLRNSITKFDPSFLQMPSQVSNYGRRWAEKVGVQLPAAEAAKLDKYSEFRATSIDAFNRYIKFITGAQMSEKEAARIQKAFPDAEKDSPTEFMSKMRAVARQTLGVNKRAQQALSKGLQVSGDQWEAVQAPPVTEQEVDAFMGTLGVPASQKATGKTELQSEVDRILGKK